MKVAALLLLACAGCDVAFSVDHVAAPADAPACLAGDEDCDGQPNLTDICPADADTPAADTDADGVGDACDPDRAVVGNRRVLFDGFDDASGAWAIKSGSWQLAGGVFTQPVIGDSRVEQPVAVTTPSIEVIITALDTGANGFAGLLGASGVSELRCNIVRQLDGTEMLQMSAFLVDLQAPLTGTGTLHLEGGQLQDGSFYCRAHHGQAFDVEVKTGPGNPQAIDKIGMITSNASVTVSSITLFDVLR